MSGTTDLKVAALKRGASRTLRALLVTAGLGCASLTGFLSNISINGVFPRLPLSNVIAPVRISELRFAMLLEKGRVSPALASASRAAAQGAPLAFEPFLYAGAATFPNDRSIGTQHGAQLLTEALHRDPRSRQARMLLLRRAVGTGQLDAAIAHLAVLDRLSHNDTARLLNGVGRSITTPAQVDEVAGALGRHPELFPEFVEGFNAAPKSTHVVLRLAFALPASAIADVAIRSGLVTKLVANQAYPEARDVARRGAKSNPSDLINDPTFSWEKSFPPFGWEYFQNGTGLAERQGKGSVFVDYFGRRSGPLLRQLLTLAPGRYRIGLEGEATEPSKGSIALRVRCADAEGDIILVPLSLKRSGHLLINETFTVPTNSCRGQFVELSGLAQEQRREQQLTVSRIVVARLTL